MENKQVTFEITEHIANVGQRGKWILELNRVSWSGNPEKLDLRSWNEDHSKCSKGLTFTQEEATMLYESLERII